MKTLNTFYKGKESIIENKIKPIIMGKSIISLRDLENFVISYCKNENIRFIKKNGKQFIVHNDYKSQLSSYSKDYFDPFKRTNHITFRYSTGVILDNSTDYEHITLNGSDNNLLLSGNIPIIIYENINNKIIKKTKYIKDIYPDDIISGLHNTHRKVDEIYECGHNKFCMILNTLPLYTEIKPFINGIQIVHEIDTCIPQLNFFKWLIENEILMYVEQNYTQITKKRTVIKKKISVVTTPYLLNDTLKVKINITKERITN